MQCCVQCCVLRYGGCCSEQHPPRSHSGAAVTNRRDRVSEPSQRRRGTVPRREASAGWRLSHLPLLARPTSPRTPSRVDQAAPLAHHGRDLLRAASLRALDAPSDDLKVRERRAQALTPGAVRLAPSCAPECLPLPRSFTLPADLPTDQVPLLVFPLLHDHYRFDIGVTRVSRPRRTSPATAPLLRVQPRRAWQ